jgi:ZIP family zinc transporter
MWLEAAFWGLIGGSALLFGAAIPFLTRLPQRLIAGVMTIGSRVLISAVAFDLMDDAFAKGGFDSTALGFLSGAGLYTAANVYLARRGARHRKRSGCMLGGQGVGAVMVAAVFLSNVPEGLASAAGMRRAGRSAGYIFGVWGAIAIASGLRLSWAMLRLRRRVPM